MYTVRHAARLTGIAPDTLRRWERRYQVVTPTRSEAGYRLYDDDALRRLSAMRALVGAGWAPRQAAAHVRAGGGSVPAAVDEAPSGSDVSLAALAIDLDPAPLDSALSGAFASAPFEDLADAWLLPSLTALGTAWERGTVSVAGEHVVSATVHRHLAAAFQAASPAAGAPRVLVGLARSSRHELGVLSFAVVLRRAGVDVIYVGSDLPTEEWAGAVVRADAAAAVLAVPMAEDVPGVRDAFGALADAAPALRLYVGGAQQDRIADPVRRLGHAVVPAARVVARALRMPPSGPASAR